MPAVAPIHVTDRRFSGMLTENRFCIPELQRPFAWGPAQVDDLIADLLALSDYLRTSLDKEPRIQHFFGTVVLLNRPGEDRKAIIDGQQRITAITVTLAILNDEFSLLQESISRSCLPDREQLIARIEVFRHEIVQCLRTAPDANGNREDRLLPSPEIQHLYASIINGGSPTIVESNVPASALRFAESEIRTLLVRNEARYRGKSVAEQLAHLISVKRAIIECLIFVAVETSSADAVYDLFESLNAKGEPLNVVDLLKVWVLSLLHGTPEEAATSQIMRDIATPGDERYAPADFLMVYFQSRLRGRMPNRSSWPKAFALDVRRNLFGESASVEAETDEFRGAVVREIRQMGVALPKYRCLISRPVKFPFNTAHVHYRDRLDTLLGGTLGHNTALPLLLSAACKLQSDTEFFDLVHMIEKVFFRVKVVCGRRETPLKAAYSQILEHLDNGTYSTAVARIVLSNLMFEKAPADDFVNCLADKLQYGSGATSRIRYFLWMLELYAGDPKPMPIAIDLHSFQLEHIHAQNNEVESLEVDEDVHRLGNLCLLSPFENSSLGNKTFPEKKLVVETWSGDGHQLRCHFTREVFKASVWTSQSIAEREQQLTERARLVFSISERDR